MRLTVSRIWVKKLVFYEQNKAPSPKVKGNFFFLPLQRYMTKQHIALHA